MIHALSQSQLFWTITHSVISVMVLWVTNHSRRRRRSCYTNTRATLHRLCLTLCHIWIILYQDPCNLRRQQIQVRSSILMWFGQKIKDLRPTALILVGSWLSHRHQRLNSCSPTNKHKVEQLFHCCRSLKDQKVRSKARFQPQMANPTTTLWCVTQRRDPELLGVHQQLFWPLILPISEPWFRSSLGSPHHPSPPHLSQEPDSIYLVHLLLWDQPI